MVVDRLEGQLELTSGSGVGTTVRLVLPRKIRSKPECEPESVKWA
jgi:hypothetical protein